MKKANWMNRVVRGLALTGSGAVVLGTSCVEDIRDAAISGGLDFVTASAEEILDSVFTFDDSLAE